MCRRRNEPLCWKQPPGDGTTAARLFLACPHRYCFHFVLLDLVMPDLRPVAFTEWVRTHHPATEVLPLTAHDRDYFLAQAVEAGVAGFLTKDEGTHRLVEAVRSAAQREAFITGGQLARALRWRKEVGERWKPSHRAGAGGAADGGTGAG